MKILILIFAIISGPAFAADVCAHAPQSELLNATVYERPACSSGVSANKICLDFQTEAARTYLIDTIRSQDGSMDTGLCVRYHLRGATLIDYPHYGDD